jgi:hypothetical protein
MIAACGQSLCQRLATPLTMGRRTGQNFAWTRQIRSMTRQMGSRTLATTSGGSDVLPLFYDACYTVQLPEKHTFPMHRYTCTHTKTHTHTHTHTHTDAHAHTDTHTHTHTHTHTQTHTHTHIYTHTYIQSHTHTYTRTHRYHAVHAAVQADTRYKKELFYPPRCEKRLITRAHEIDYVEAFLETKLGPKEVRTIGFPLGPAFVERTLAITGTCTRMLFRREPPVSSQQSEGRRQHKSASR